MQTRSIRRKPTRMVLTALLALAFGGFLTPSPAFAAEPIDPNIYTEAETVKDLNTWSLPTDPYVGNKFDDLEIAATNIYAAKCMRDQGYSDVFFEYDLAGNDAPNVMANNSWVNLTPEYAAQYGYRFAPDPRITKNTLPSDLISDPYDDEEDQRYNVYRDCKIAGWANLLGISVEEYHRLSLTTFIEPGLVYGQEEPLEEAYNWIESDPLLRTPIRRWRACMRAANVGSVPSAPRIVSGNVAPPNIADAFDWDDHYDLHGQASDEEKAFATADARCRVSSGWNQVQYDLLWESRQEYVNNLRGELDERRIRLEGRAKRAIDVILAHQ